MAGFGPAIHVFPCMAIAELFAPLLRSVPHAQVKSMLTTAHESS